MPDDACNAHACQPVSLTAPGLLLLPPLLLRHCRMLPQDRPSLSGFLVLRLLGTLLAAFCPGLALARHCHYEEQYRWPMAGHGHTESEGMRGCRCGRSVALLRPSGPELAAVVPFAAVCSTTTRSCLASTTRQQTRVWKRYRGTSCTGIYERLTGSLSVPPTHPPTQLILCHLRMWQTMADCHLLV